MNSTLLLLLGLLFLIILLGMFNRREGYGQDASIRASVGGLAGPAGLYSYDPIAIFGQQIKERNEDFFRRTGIRVPE